MERRGVSSCDERSRHRDERRLSPGPRPRSPNAPSSRSRPMPSRSGTCMREKVLPTSRGIRRRVSTLTAIIVTNASGTLNAAG